MTDEELMQHIDRLRLQGSDDARVEAKAASKGLPKSLWATVSAFANTDGGVVLLGLDESEGFHPVPGFDADRIVNQLSAGLGQKEAKVQPVPRNRIGRAVVGGMNVVVLEIEPLRGVDQLPCFVVEQGVQRGSYKRVDDHDQHLTPYEVHILETSSRPQGTDTNPVPGVAIGDLSEQYVSRLLRQVSSGRSHALDGLHEGDTDGALKRLGIVDRHGIPVLSGYLTLAPYPQQRYPQLAVDVAVHPSTTKSARADVRFLDRQTCDGPLPVMIEDAVTAVARNLKRRRVVTGVEGTDELEIPEDVLREAITNAVTHRDYSEPALGRQVAVDVYPDRVEIISPGGFYGDRTVENVAEGRSDSRNPNLARLLTLVPRADGNGFVCENQGSGVPRMMAAMRGSGLRAPDYSASDIGQVVLRLSRFGLIDDATNAWLADLPGSPRQTRENAALALVRRDGRVGVAELRANLGLDSDDARDALAALVSEGLLIGAGDGPYVLNQQKRSALASGARREILAVLDTARAMSVRDIAAATGKSVTALRPLLRELVEEGLVIATAPPTSRNRTYLLAE